MGDHNVFHDRYIELLSAMMADVRSRCITFPIPSDLIYISNRIRNEGEQFAYNTLPLLGKALDKALATGQFICPAVFVKKKESALPRLFYQGFNLVFRDDGTLRQTCSPTSVQALRQLLLFDSKAERPFLPEELANFEAAYRKQQRTLRTYKVPVDHVILQTAKAVITRCLSGFPIDSFNLDPKHGPGATAEGFDPVEKWKFEEWPKKLERFFPYAQYGCLNLYESFRVNKKGIPLTSPCVTKACFVPKDFRGPRLISIEPCAMQYVQQAMNRWLERAIAASSVTNRSIFLDDQSRNAEAARLAYDNECATVDLSSASDTLSATLVWHLFSGLPHLRRLLFSLRSDFVGFPTGPERLVSFAPMGSAICFPIETLCFFSLAVASVMETHRIGLYRAASLVRVYGDDIVVPTGALSQLLPLFSQLGLQPNMSKTCYATPFRESCGVEYYAGEDVTISRYKDFLYTCRDISHHPVLRSLQRRFFSKGYYETARVLLRWCRAIYPTNTVKIGSRCDEDLYCFDDVVNYTSKRRWNPDYQVSEVLVPVFAPKVRVWHPKDSDEALRASLISLSYSQRFAIRYRKVTKIAWRRADLLERADL